MYICIFWSCLNFSKNPQSRVNFEVRTFNKHSNGNHRQSYDWNVGFATFDNRATWIWDDGSAHGDRRVHFSSSENRLPRGRPRGGVNCLPNSSLLTKYFAGIRSFTIITNGAKPTVSARFGSIFWAKIVSIWIYRVSNLMVATRLPRMVEMRWAIKVEKHAAPRTPYLCLIVKVLC